MITGRQIRTTVEVVPRRGSMTSDINALPVGGENSAAIRGAAAELADRLKKHAGTLALRQKTTRVRFGHGRLGRSFKRQSPEGFILDAANLQMLLPDGRLWAYSRSDSNRFPAGRFYDALTDYTQFSGSRTFPGGREFVFLGAVLGGYTFGFSVHGGRRHHADSPGLWAICGEGRSIRYATADEAFAAIAESAPADGVNTKE